MLKVLKFFKYLNKNITFPPRNSNKDDTGQLNHGTVRWIVALTHPQGQVHCQGHRPAERSDFSQVEVQETRDHGCARYDFV